MNKIGLIIAREYLSRVRKRSFIIMTVLGPLLFAGITIVPTWLASRDGEEKIVEVVDDSGLFVGKLEDANSVSFRFIDKNIEQAKEGFLQNKDYGLLYIPKVDIDEPKGIVLYSLNNPSFSLKRSLERKIRDELETVKLKNSGIDQATLDGLQSNVTVQTINLSESGDESESSSEVASIVGYASAFLIYFFIFFYGAQIMRGVIEEKTSRIIEVMISSVKPFQLMMGKIIGVGAVGLTQFLLWVLISTGVFSIGKSLEQAITDDSNTSIKTEQTIEASQTLQQKSSMFENISKAGEKVNIPLVIGCFIFYFIGGYLLYGALFASVGSAVDSDADSQQFMLPITIPLIFSMVVLAAVLNDPHGSLAFWMSVIPFTSPVVMMMRIPFEVPVWQLLLSMFSVVGGFLFTTWFAGRIYRVGIFMHGTKVNYKILAKWFTMKV